MATITFASTLPASFASSPRSTHEELAALRRRVDELEAENIYLRSTLYPALHPLREAFGLTISEDRLLVHLARGGWYSRQQIMIALNADESYWERNVDSLVKRIRRKISPITISSAYGIGYSLEGESLKAIRQLIANKEKTR